MWHINDAIVTNNGAISITATDGAATMASGTALVSGNAPIAIDGGGDVTTRGISGGSLSATSTGGSVHGQRCHRRRHGPRRPERRAAT